MKNRYNLPAVLAIWFINNIWKKRLGPYYKKKHRIICRFYPTCSDYAVIAFKKYGLIKGVYLSFRRIRRCTPNNTESCFDYPKL